MLFVRSLERNQFCKTILEKRGQTSWYYAAQHYKYMQQINGASWPHGPEYCSIHDSFIIKKAVVVSFRFLFGFFVTNAFQLKRMRNLDQREKRLDALAFRRAIADAYFWKCCKSATNTTLRLGNGLLRNTAENLGYDNCGNWIVKAV